MAKTVTLKEWLDYLESRVGIDLYVWGGNGELFIEQMPKLCNMEKDDHTDKAALDNTDRVLTLLQKRLKNGVNIFDIRGEDCSGLGIAFLLSHNVLKSDTNANGIWKYIVGTKETEAHGKKVALSDVKAGDYLFMGNSDNKWHIGYAIDNKYAVESKNHDVGVVKTVIAERGWGYAARPNWYSDSPSPEPSKPVLKRDLYLANPYMRGDDVEDAQMLLADKGYNPGSFDGVFGTKTESATKGFQTDNGLKADGIIGKNTATKLGFKWEGDY